MLVLSCELVGGRAMPVPRSFLLKTILICNCITLGRLGKDYARVCIILKIAGNFVA
jgi:hypothetical protein